MIFKNTQQKINCVRINGIPDFKNTILGKQVQRTLKYTTWLCLQRRVLVRLSPLNILPWNEVPEHLQAHPNKERNVPGSMSHLPSRAHKGHSGRNDTLGVAKELGEGLAKPRAASLRIIWVPVSLGTHTRSGPKTDWWHFSSQLRRHKKPHFELCEILVF